MAEVAAGEGALQMYSMRSVSKDSEGNNRIDSCY
jgi:hypothetical protein